MSSPGSSCCFPQPFGVGDRSCSAPARSAARSRAPTEIGISYVRLDTADGMIQLPSSAGSRVSGRACLLRCRGPGGRAGRAEQAPTQAASENAPPGPAARRRRQPITSSARGTTRQGACGTSRVRVSGGRPRTGRPRRRECGRGHLPPCPSSSPRPGRSRCAGGGCRSAFLPRRRAGQCAQTGKTADRLVEAVAVPGAQVHLVVAAIEAEPAHPMLARWNSLWS